MLFAFSSKDLLSLNKTKDDNNGSTYSEMAWHMATRRRWLIKASAGSGWGFRHYELRLLIGSVIKNGPVTKLSVNLLHMQL